MKVLVVGAGGKTGRLVVEQAVAAGHTVTALLHKAKPHESFSVEVELVHGDVRNPSRLDQIMTGQQAVIDCIGGDTPFLETTLEADAARVVIDTMKKNGVKRLLVVSALGVGDSGAQAGWFYEHLLVPMYLSGAVRDKSNMESEVEGSGLDFTIVRPSVLKDSDATGQVHVIAPGEIAHEITRADLAHFLVAQLGSQQYSGQHITVSNR